MRLIDADELYKEIIQNEDLARDRVISTEEMIGDRVNPMFTRYCAQLDEQSAFKYMIMDAPTVDAVPVRHGRWVGNERHTSCSICGQTYCVPDGQEEHLDMTFYKYCPNCGSRMDGERKEE